MTSTGPRASDHLLLSTRFALGAGFGGLLAIMTLAGVYGIRALQKIRRDENQIRNQFLLQNHELNEIRSQLYLSGSYVRDYLREPEPGRAETYRASLEEVHRQMETQLESFGRELAPDQTKYYTELSAKLSTYWLILAPILTWDSAQRHLEGSAYLRNEILPRRTAMLAIAGQIADVNGQQLDAGSHRVDHLLAEFQNRMALVLSGTLLLGLGMAAFSTGKILGLESRANAQYQEVVEARKQLEELSARLVHAQENERRVLSRELHDEVGQALSAVLVELRNLWAESTIQTDEQSRGHVETVKSLVEDSVRVVRNMALLLRPSMLDDLGLVPALRWQAREVSKRTSLEVSVAAELASDDLPDAYKTCIYRVVQEAMHNCSRHACATKVQIRVQQEPSRLSLSIQDDGRGFDVNLTRGLGLLGIEERVARLGGKCEIHSGAESGTIVAIELPFNNNERNRDSRGSEEDSNSIGGRS